MIFFLWSPTSHVYLVQIQHIIDVLVFTYKRLYIFYLWMYLHMHIVCVKGSGMLSASHRWNSQMVTYGLAMFVVDLEIRVQLQWSFRSVKHGCTNIVRFGWSIGEVQGPYFDGITIIIVPISVIIFPIQLHDTRVHNDIQIITVIIGGILPLERSP